jgi:hypothetical protein
MSANGTSNPLDFDELTEIIRRAADMALLITRYTQSIHHSDLGGV